MFYCMFYYSCANSIMTVKVNFKMAAAAILDFSGIEF